MRTQVAVAALLLVACPAGADEAHTDEPDGAITIIVEDRVEAARRKLLEDAAALGYGRVKRHGDRLLVGHELAWKGQLVLYDDGRVTFTRAPIRVEPPGGKHDVLGWISCLRTQSNCFKVGGQTVVPRIFRDVERKALAALHDDIVALGDAIATRAVEARIVTLVGRFEELWATGAPLDGGPAATTWEARRAALFAWWDSRTETPQGEAVRDAVEAFVRGVVQSSDHPFTDDEVEAFDARRSVARHFLGGGAAP